MAKVQGQRSAFFYLHVLSHCSPVINTDQFVILVLISSHECVLISWISGWRASSKMHTQRRLTLCYNFPGNWLCDRCLDLCFEWRNSNMAASRFKPRLHSRQVSKLKIARIKFLLDKINEVDRIDHVD